MGLMFYPRGGSAQVARYLSRELVELGWEVLLVSGSLGDPGDETHAATFFEGVAVYPVDYTAALERFQRGEDHLAGPIPFQGSFEDREGAPDRVFTRLDPAQSRAQVGAWQSAFTGAGFADVELLHLHHLTPLHEAVSRLWPDRPLITHLHGTELKLLDRSHHLQAAARPTTGFAQPGMQDGEPEASAIWASSLALQWASRSSASARSSQSVVSTSPQQAAEAHRLLDLPEERIAVIPNGVDTTHFRRLPLTREERLRLLRLWLVDDPRGQTETGEIGSIRYGPDELSAFTDKAGEPLPLLIFVGRFLAFKRVPLLVRAYARARARFDVPAPLLIWGGAPREWEAEHPHTVATQLDVEGVFFSGWRGHTDLPFGLSCADIFVAPSVEEPFGQVFLEAMSCGLPVITTNTGGPPSFVNTITGKPNGWLVEPDDSDALADALVDAVNNPAERKARAHHAQQHVRRTFSWRDVAQRFETLYDHVLNQTGEPPSQRIPA